MPSNRDSHASGHKYDFRLHFAQPPQSQLVLHVELTTGPPQELGHEPNALEVVYFSSKQSNVP